MIVVRDIEEGFITEVDLIQWTVPFLSICTSTYCPNRQRNVIRILTNHSHRHPKTRLLVGYTFAYALLQKISNGKFTELSKITAILLSWLGFLPIFRFNYIER